MGPLNTLKHWYVGLLIVFLAASALKLHVSCWTSISSASFRSAAAKHEANYPNTPSAPSRCDGNGRSNCTQWTQAPACDVGFVICAGVGSAVNSVNLQKAPNASRPIIRIYSLSFCTFPWRLRSRVRPAHSPHLRGSLCPDSCVIITPSSSSFSWKSAEEVNIPLQVFPLRETGSSVHLLSRFCPAMRRLTLKMTLEQLQGSLFWADRWASGGNVRNRRVFLFLFMLWLCFWVCFRAKLHLASSSLAAQVVERTAHGVTAAPPPVLVFTWPCRTRTRMWRTSLLQTSAVFTSCI